MVIVGFQPVLNKILVLQEALHCDGVVPYYVMACWHKKEQGVIDCNYIFIKNILDISQCYCDVSIKMTY